MKARDLGIPFEGTPGKHNSITDVEGVLVGHSTIIKGEGKLVVGKGPIRTGVTTVLPLGKTGDEVFASYFSFNGNGEMTGSNWLDETGHLKGPISITNTHSVGVVRDTVIDWMLENELFRGNIFWGLPVVAETYDGLLNDVNGFHITKSHIFESLDSAKSGEISEGNVGGGTGMMCHQFKGGIGTSSRVLEIKEFSYTLGALVQSNYGLRKDLTISGVPVGIELKDILLPEVNLKSYDKSTIGDQGSIIVIIATDAPLLPYQLKRIAKRVTSGLARVGGYGYNGSGDIFVAFSTGNILDSMNNETPLKNYNSLDDNLINPLFKATAEVTEEAIINALVNAKTMKGINDNTIHAIPQEKLIELLKKYNRIQ